MYEKISKTCTKLRTTLEDFHWSIVNANKQISLLQHQTNTKNKPEIYKNIPKIYKIYPKYTTCTR